jgi:hypothetical protein
LTDLIENTNHYSNKTLLKTIQQSFFLKENTVITTQMVSAFKAGLVSSNFQPLSEITANQHTDQFSIHITHDIDWLNPHHPYSLVKSLRATLSKHPWLSLKQVVQQDILLRNIEQLLSLEKELDIQAIYCLGSSSGLQMGRYDIRYSSHSRMFNEFKTMLNTYIQTIALHSSIDAAQTNQLAYEISSLQLHSKQPVPIQRCHYLKHSTPAFYQMLAQKGIRYDIGYGRAQTVGLLNHFPGKFKPIDPISLLPIDITIIPLILLDNVFFKQSYHEVITAFRKTLDTLKQYNGSACLLFHPENMLVKPQLYSYFEEIIHICKQEGAIINPPLT